MKRKTQKQICFKVIIYVSIIILIIVNLFYLLNNIYKDNRNNDSTKLYENLLQIKSNSNNQLTNNPNSLISSIKETAKNNKITLDLADSNIINNNQNNNNLEKFQSLNKTPKKKSFSEKSQENVENKIEFDKIVRT